jgi:hypothetical protein
MKKLSGGAVSAKAPASERTLSEGAAAVSVVLVMSVKMAYAVDKHNFNQ